MSKFKKVIRYFKRFKFQGILQLIRFLVSRREQVSIKFSEFPHPFFLRPRSSDPRVFEQIFISEEYNVKLDFEPSVIVDCGANIGLSAIYLKQRFPNATIFAIEPEESNFRLLQMNTEAYPDIICINQAIWNEVTGLKIRNPQAKSWGFRMEPDDKQDNNNIKSITLNQLMENYGIEHIDILKIDIEGSEMELFESNYENWLPRTKMMLIEFHERFRPGSSESFFRAMANYNHSTSQLGENLIVYLK